MTFKLHSLPPSPPFFFWRERIGPKLPIKHSCLHTIKTCLVSEGFLMFIHITIYIYSLGDDHTHHDSMGQPSVRKRRKLM